MRPRLAFVLVAMTLGCGAANARGPSWPKQTPKDVDGGESLAPHVATTVTADRSSDSIDVRPDSDSKPAPAVDKPATSDAPASTPAPPAATPDEPITTEDIVIEIDD